MKDCRIPEYGSLENLKNQKTVVGAKQLRKAFAKGIVRWVSSMAELGSACGIDVGAAAAAAVD